MSWGWRGPGSAEAAEGEPGVRGVLGIGVEAGDGEVRGGQIWGWL